MLLCHQWTIRYVVKQNHCSFSPIAYDFTNPKNLIGEILAFIVLDPNVTCQLSLISNKHTTYPEEKLGGEI